MPRYLAQVRNPMMQCPNGTGPVPARLRKTALLLFAALSLVIALLALAFTSFALDPFPPSAPPM